MAAELVIETFADRVGQSFTAAPTLGGDPLELVLSECEAAPESGPPEGRMPFSLIFHAPGPGYLPQQIFSVGHAELGDLDLFLVPLGPSQKGMAYQAVVN
jgi:hypothetical protein